MNDKTKVRLFKNGTRGYNLWLQAHGSEKGIGIFLRDDTCPSWVRESIRSLAGFSSHDELPINSDEFCRALLKALRAVYDEGG